MKKSFGLVSFCILFTACHNPSFEASNVDLNSTANAEDSKTINLNNAISNLVITKFSIPEFATKNSEFNITASVNSPKNYTYALSLDPDAKDVVSWSKSIPKKFSLSNPGKQQKLYFFAKKNDKNGTKYKRYALITINPTDNNTLASTNSTQPNPGITSITSAINVTKSDINNFIIPQTAYAGDYFHLSPSMNGNASDYTYCVSLSSAVPTKDHFFDLLPSSFIIQSSGNYNVYLYAMNKKTNNVSVASAPIQILASLTQSTNSNNTPRIPSSTTITNTPATSANIPDSSTNGYNFEYGAPGFVRTNSGLSMDCTQMFNMLNWSSQTSLTLSFSTDSWSVVSDGPYLKQETFNVAFHGPKNTGFGSTSGAIYSGITLLFSQVNGSGKSTAVPSQMRPFFYGSFFDEINFGVSYDYSFFNIGLNRDFYNSVATWGSVKVEIQCHGVTVNSATADLSVIKSTMDGHWETTDNYNQSGSFFWKAGNSDSDNKKLYIFVDAKN